MNVVRISRVGLFAILLGLVFASCEKDFLNFGNNNTDQEESFFGLFNEFDDDDDDDDDDEFGCVDIVYPIDIQFPDGTTQAVNSDTELDSLIEAWYDNNPTSNNDPTLVFPIQVIDEDSTVITANDEEEFCELFFGCYDDCDDDEDCDDWDDEEDLCFEIIYPVDLILPDGTTITVNDDEELETAIENYYDANPNDTNFISFSYPITVTLFENDSIITINDDDELEELFESCFEDFDDCFDIVYPIDVMLPDSTIVTANDEDALEQIFDDWFDNNPNSTDEPELVFPFDVILDDGTTETINDWDEFEELLEDCFDDWCMTAPNTQQQDYNTTSDTWS